MHLNRLVLHNFKKYRRAQIDFQDGLTGIVGGNGVGKSTIVEAIAWALYGNRASLIKRELIKNDLAPAHEPLEVQLSMNLGKQELVIYRAMKGRNMIPDTALSIDGRRVAFGSKEVDLQLEKLLKISYQDFMRTFYARQKDLDNLLKEGGMGKREYLLKLLGLEEIREKAIDRIKEDSRRLEGERDRLMGAVLEIGEVDQKMDEVSSRLQEARSVLSRAQGSEAAFEAELENKKHELDGEIERKRSHDLLLAAISKLEEIAEEKSVILKREDRRLQEIEQHKATLSQLLPKLQRLDWVSARLDLLEPKRLKYDQLLQQKLKISGEMEGKSRFLGDRQERLQSLRAEEKEIQSLQEREREYQSLLRETSTLEELQGRYEESQRQLAMKKAMLDGIVSGISRLEESLKELFEAKERLDRILPMVSRFKICQDEHSFILQERDRQRNLEGLSARRLELLSRQERLSGQMRLLRQEISGLGDLDAREREIRLQDQELDGLGSELNSTLASLRADLGVEERKVMEAQKDLSRIQGLGPRGSCPTCERPLGEQHSLLVKKYEQAREEARAKAAILRKRLEETKVRVQGVVQARTGLKSSFDQLSALRSRRAELIADERNFKVHLEELSSEVLRIEEEIASIGPVSYDPQRQRDIEEELERLAPLAKEHPLLEAKVQALPLRLKEEEALKLQLREVAEEMGRLDELILSLGYDPAKHQDKRRSLEELRGVHQRFSSLEERIKEIPSLEGAVSSLQAELSDLEGARAGLEEDLVSLGFNPEEYRALLEERKALSLVDSQAQKLKIAIAGEAEARERYREASCSLTSLEAECKSHKDKLLALNFRPEKLEECKQALNGAKDGLEAARKAALEAQVRQSVAEMDLERLLKDASRKKDHEARISVLSRKLEVVESVRGLLNRFMDHVLVSVKDDIAKTAGSILEEISGKYSLLKIDENLNIWVEDGGEDYPISRFSGGEIDMIALSVRVAISEYLMRFREEGLGYSFMILDEVFGSQDIEHRENMINMLRRLDQRFPQIFAISHISDVQGQFDNTIQVIEDEMGNSFVEVS